MFSLTVSDHIMIAHSFRGAEFGPAQKLHGATFVVEAEFRAPLLDRLNLLVDIGLARAELRRALDTLDYRNLDDEAQFRGENTTTEFLCRHVFDEMTAAAREGRLGPGSDGVDRIRVTLHESPLARAWFEGPVGG